jgi:hypothetical protein
MKKRSINPVIIGISTLIVCLTNTGCVGILDPIGYPMYLMSTVQATNSSSLPKKLNFSKIPEEGYGNTLSANSFEASFIEEVASGLELPSGQTVPRISVL